MDLITISASILQLVAITIFAFIIGISFAAGVVIVKGIHLLIRNLISGGDDDYTQ